MTDLDSTGIAHVESDNNTTVTCPSCKRNKTVFVKKFKEKQHEIKVRCSCGHDFTLQLEFRKHHRKETFLSGDYNLERSSGIAEAGHIRVIDLSIKGACFEVRGLHDITPGLEGELVFTLDDQKQSVLFKEVVIRNVNGSRIGCEFLEKDSPSKELGTYIISENL